MSVHVGVDGCKAGWVAVWRDGPDEMPSVGVYRDFAGPVDHFPDDATLVVEMPIGLPDFIHGGGRGPEQAVRPHLKERQSSVFSVPSRSAVYAVTEAHVTQAEVIAAHKRASSVALQTSNPPRKISIQAFMLFPKIREIDILLRRKPELSRRIFESHPEFAFTILNAGLPMNLPKKIRGRINREGMDERRNLLARHGIARSFLDRTPPKGAGDDDFLDACAMLLIADRVASGEALPHPGPLQHDSHGIPVSIWA